MGMMMIEIMSEPPSLKYHPETHPHSKLSPLHHHTDSPASPPMATTAKLQAQLKAKHAVLQVRPGILDSLPVINKELERQIALVHTAGSVAQAVGSGELAATDVLAVCIKRTHLLGKQLLNAVSEEGLYQDAWIKAQEIDAAVKSGREDAHALSSPSPTTSTHTPTKSKGLVRTALHRLSKGVASTLTTSEPYDCAPTPTPLLLGVPVSIKDHIDIKGFDSTIGLIARTGLPKAEDALAVELLRDAGAIIYSKTTNPQACLIFETDSNVFGLSKNPWDQERTPGGSSGGEGALVGVRGSLLGIGTDVGGSIRYPANANGIYGFKPTPQRVSVKGLSLPFIGRSGQNDILVTLGPMGRSVDDLARVCKAWMVEKMWTRDPLVTPKPFDHHAYLHGRSSLTTGRGPGDIANSSDGRPLRVGYFLTDNWFEPCSASRRAVLEAKAGLERAGVEVVPVSLPEGQDGWQVMRLFYGILGADGSLHTILQGLEGEERTNHTDTLHFLASLPDVLRKGLDWLLYFKGEERARLFNAAFRRHGLSVREYWSLIAATELFQQSWLGLLDDHGLDGLLCAGAGLPAFPHGLAASAGYSVSHLPLFNLLHWPAGVVPITTVRPDETTYHARESLPVNQQDDGVAAANVVLANAAGLPMGVQLATRPNMDELCLHLMGLLEKEVGFKDVPDCALVK